MLDSNPPGLLDRAGLRKAAVDAGFDMLADVAAAVVARSSHAPLVCVVGRAAPEGYAAGLSMANVVQALNEVDRRVVGRAASGPSESGTVEQTELPAMAGWFSCRDLPALEGLLARAWALSRALPNELERRFEAALAAVQATEREATVRQRIGQNLFREGLMSLWGGRCAVTGLDVPALLRASHAKPWADSNDAERMDVYNGLLLAAHWDAAFDAGLVSFDVDGRPLWSPKLSQAGVELLRQSSAVGVLLAPRHLAYMAWHRDRVWQA